MYSRRLARVIISHRLQLSKRALRQILDSLPDDATIVRAGEDLSRAETFLVFESSSLPEVPEAHVIPEFKPNTVQTPFDDDESWGSPDLAELFGSRTIKHCTCDKDYCGYKYHLKGCPAAG